MKTIRCFRLAVIALVSATLAACGGGGQQGATSMLPTTSQSTNTPAPSVAPMSIVSVSGSTLTVTGQIVALRTDGFQIQGGQGLGYYNIATTSSTSFTGAKPYVGETIKATGTGSASTSMTATSVSQITSGSLLSASGPIVALKTGGFQINGGQSVGYLNVWTNSSTSFTGAKPFVGENVNVSGTGSFSTSLTAVTVTQITSSTASPTPTPQPTAVPVVVPSNAPAASAFMPSTWGKISAFQIFDETSNGYITQAAASADGYRYSAIWGSRWNIGTSWNNSNAGLQTAYYNALETDPSYTGWGAIGHDLTWWNANHPDWVLYACTSAGSVTTYPAYVPGLTTAIPLDIHNPAVVDYQVRAMANYAHKIGYHALAIDEATFWQADAGAGSGSYGCAIHQNGSIVQRYTGVTDPKWATDVVQWVKIAHSILTTDPTIATYHLKLIVNHPANALTANETAFLANVDADLDETGYVDYGRPTLQNSGTFKQRTDWATYAQQHGIAVLMNANWGKVTVGTPQLDFSVATYLIRNQQAESLYVAQANQYGLETWHAQYDTKIGAPCGAYYADASSASVFYRRFANAVAVANISTASQTLHLPAGHAYTDIFGRAVPATIAPGDGYVLATSNGCQ
jgi:hypothetical protein